MATEEMTAVVELQDNTQPQVYDKNQYSIDKIIENVKTVALRRS